MATVEEVKARFGELAELLNFTENQQYIIIKPRQFLGSDNFAKIAAITRNNGGEYISAGKESHLRIPRTTITNTPNKFTPSDPQAVTQHIDDIINRLEALKKEIEEMIRK